MSAAGFLSIEWEITDQHLPMQPPHTLRRCPACGVHIYDLTDVEGDNQ